MIEEFDVDLSDLTGDLDSKLDVNLVKSKIPEYSSEKLCEMIVCDRYLGFNKEIALSCMEELSRRRIAGDSFPFEDYIENSEKDLPPLNFSLPDLRVLLSQLMKK